MQALTQEGQQALEAIAARYGVSADAALHLLYALARGNGTMAQFNHPDLGGGGQWMQGGMTMVSDLFNNALKAKVDGLCTELSTLLMHQPFKPAPPPSQIQSQSQGGSVSLSVSGYGSGNWWPEELGSPSTSGAQNDVRYAYFPDKRRLAIEIGGRVAVYDTLDHQIGGVSQQQGGGSTVTFSSQHGVVALADLPRITGGADKPAPAPAPTSAEPPVAATGRPAASTATSHEDIFAKIEKLAELKQKGILTETEYQEKKAELLGRL